MNRFGEFKIMQIEGAGNRQGVYLSIMQDSNFCKRILRKLRILQTELAKASKNYF